MEQYKTVEAAGMDEFTEKRSRFIGYCRPVGTQEQALAFLEEKRREHWDAAHNVYAYVLRGGFGTLQRRRRAAGYCGRSGARGNKKERRNRRVRYSNALFRRRTVGRGGPGSRVFPRGRACARRGEYRYNAAVQNLSCILPL